ncbi:Beta-fructofuranosidase, insoluble isoenzyme 1 [Camellia lanceoleosa]|uniref:Beta-fructofuranosidase, insoluble isoenzyme 1 n=1 Tax=Camellia lanceoleosa TaxID=1840588 RepID=A0ACC0HSM4_9ERIC|nr:Beta-fructofuranosidase, insoluble isoenzyme 1 [Camellia lanceoleosa]
MYYNGIYHFFYQYNPKGAVWGNIVWAHSVLTDLINWKPLPPAIYPSKPFDQYGTWSGSATILPGNKPIILYTGIIDKNNTQVQNYAIPTNYSDPYLQKWIKPNNNPLVSLVGVNKTAFRDPTTAWFGKDGHWRMLVGGRRKHRGMAHLYRSRDFMKWTKAQHPLHSSAMTGMWECPTFTVSLDYENGLETIPRKVWLDKSEKQLVQWPVEELETLRRRKVHLSNQKLNLADHADVEVTFSFPSMDKAEAFDPSWVNMDAQELCKHKGSTVQGGVGPFGLLTLASQHLEEYTPVFFRVFKAKDNHVVLMCSDATSSSLKKKLYKPSFAGFVNVDLAQNKLSLRSLIDNSVVESFGVGGKTCITSRVYPTLAVCKDAHLYIFNNGTETVTVENLDAWSMNYPLMN